MNQPRRRNNNQNRRPQQQQGRARKSTDLWRPVPQLPPAEPIAPAADPTALLRSLGDPPLQGQGAVAEHYLAAVIERAAMLATALAASAGLLATEDDELS